MTGGFQGGYGTPGSGAPTQVRVQRSNTSGCVWWGIGGCGALVLAVVITFWFVGRSAFDKFHLKDAINQIGTCTETMADVSSALQAYQHDHKGQYPASLKTLVPKYIADVSGFTCGSASAPVTLEYIAPSKNVQPDDVVLKVKTFDLPVAGQTIRQYAAVLADGSLVQMQYSPLPGTISAGHGPSRIPTGDGPVKSSDKASEKDSDKDADKDSKDGGGAKSQQ